MKLPEQLSVAVQARIDKEGRLMRIGDDFLVEMIAAIGRMTDDADGEAGAVEVLGYRIEVAAFLVKEGLAVGDQELHVADLWLIDRREINLVEDSGRRGKPQTAHRRVCGADGVLGAAGPARLDAGRAGGDGRCQDSCHAIPIRSVRTIRLSRAVADLSPAFPRAGFGTSTRRRR